MVKFPSYSYPMTDDETADLIMIYLNSHGSATEEELESFVYHYELTRLGITLWELAAEGSAQTGYNDKEEVVFRKARDTRKVS